MRPLSGLNQIVSFNQPGIETCPSGQRRFGSRYSPLLPTPVSGNRRRDQPPYFEEVGAAEVWILRASRTRKFPLFQPPRSAYFGLPVLSPTIEPGLREDKGSTQICASVRVSSVPGRFLRRATLNSKPRFLETLESWGTSTGPERGIPFKTQALL